MKLIVGLGNPGEKYRNTRHNAGFVMLDAIQKIRNLKFKYISKWEAEVVMSEGLVLMKPQTYMNGSGMAVQKVLRFYRMRSENVWIVHDDLDIRLGEYKIQFGRGPKMHNGITSIETALGTKDFWRVRVGVDNRQQLPATSHQVITVNSQQPIASRQQQKVRNQKLSGEEYVLGSFLPEEREIIGGMIDIVGRELLEMIKES